jgi:hypothetical protein
MKNNKNLLATDGTLVLITKGRRPNKYGANSRKRIAPFAISS